MFQKFGKSIPQSLVDAVSGIMSEAKADDLPPIDKDAAAARKARQARLDAIEDAKAEKDSGEKKSSVVRKVAGSAYGGAKQKDPEDMEEELHPNQKVLDKNKNGKLDSDDFKKLRKEEEEVEELDEAKDVVNKDASGKVTSWSHEGDWKKSTKKNPQGIAPRLSDLARRKTIKMAKETMMGKAGCTSEEAEIEESRGHKIIANKLAQIDRMSSGVAPDHNTNAQSTKDKIKDTSNIDKVEIVTQKDTTISGKNNEADQMETKRKLNKISHGYGNVVHKEEVVNELTKKTLGSYIKKASSSSDERSASNLASKAAAKLAADDGKDDGEKDDMKSFQRSKGIGRAVDRLAKEEVYIDDADDLDESIVGKAKHLVKGIKRMAAGKPSASASEKDADTKARQRYSDSEVHSRAAKDAVYDFKSPNKRVFANRISAANYNIKKGDHQSRRADRIAALRDKVAKEQVEYNLNEGPSDRGDRDSRLRAGINAVNTRTSGTQTAGQKLLSKVTGGRVKAHTKTDPQTGNKFHDVTLVKNKKGPSKRPIGRIGNIDFNKQEEVEMNESHNFTPNVDSHVKSLGHGKIGFVMDQQKDGLLAVHHQDGGKHHLAIFHKDKLVHTSTHNDFETASGQAHTSLTTKKGIKSLSMNEEVQIDETASLDQYIKSMGYNPDQMDKNKKVMFSKTNAFKTWASTRQEGLYDAGQKGTQDIDTHMAPGATARG